MHRDDLFDITLRWLNNDPREDDGRRLSEIFLFESAVSAPIVQDIMLNLFGRLYGERLSVERVQYKDALRARLIEGIPRFPPRVQDLVAAYQASPEEFFPGMPVDAMLLSTPTRSLVSISRIKRPSRVAEKTAYRLSDALADRVRQEAEVFASARAFARGVPLQHLISTEAQMDEDFVAAERVVAGAFRDGAVIFPRDQLTINDVIGFKVIGDEGELLLAEHIFAEESGVTVVEREEHRGHYNATNLLLDIDLPPVGRIIDDNAHRDWHQAAQRGLDPATAPQRFAEYVESGARTVRTATATPTPARSLRTPATSSSTCSPSPTRRPSKSTACPSSSGVATCPTPCSPPSATFTASGRTACSSGSCLTEYSVLQPEPGEPQKTQKPQKGMGLVRR
jgi:hypothetical protein